MEPKRRPKVGEWEEVPGKRRSRRNVAEEWVDNRKNQLTKFFVSNLPGACPKKEVSDLFGDFGEVVSVYIARKRNASGEIFGFISFANVYDGLELQRKLGKVSLGGNKLRVNIAKYAVENFDQRFAVKKRVSREEVGQENPAVENRRVRLDSAVHGGSSYRDKLVNSIGLGRSGDSGRLEKVVQVKEEMAAFEELHGKAVIGKVLDFETLRNVKSLMQEGSWDGFEVVYIGGLYVLVAFEEGGTASLFYQSKEWKSWFQEIDMWKGQTVPFEKLAWLNVVGVPLHLARKEVYDMIGGKFGEVVHHADPHVEDGDISAGCIGVLRDSGVVIFEEVKLSWKSSLFSVWVKEVRGSWIPKGIGKVGRRSKVDEVCSEGSSEFMEESSNSSRESDKKESKESKLEDEESALHGEHEDRGEKEESTFEGGGVPFKGINYGEVFPRLKKNKRKVKIIKKANVGGTSQIHGAGSNSVSPRPRKRPRSEDIFGLDEIIGIGLNSVVQETVNKEIRDNMEVSIDLNKVVDSVVNEGCNGSKSTSNGIESSSGPFVAKDVSEEIRKTVDIGKKIGVALDGFEREVEEVILEEGMDDLIR